MDNLSENKMGVMPVRKLLLTMGLPMVLSMVVQATYNVVDSIFVSWIAENALTAVTMAFPVQNMIVAFALGFGIGTNALLSRALGEKNRKRASLVALNGIALEVFSYLIFLTAGIFLVEFYMRSQTDVEEIVRYGVDYIRIVTIGSIGVFMMITTERLLQSTGRMKYAMLIQLTGALTNIIFDPILIFGLLGFPALGIKGAAYATVGGQWLGSLLGIYFCFKKNPEVELKFRNFRLDRSIIRDMSNISIPSIVMSSISSVMTYLMNLILFGFSPTAVAVFGSYFKLQSFVFMPVFGINNALVPIVAYNYGARKPKRIKDVIKFAAFCASCIMLVGITIFESLPDKLLSMFDASADMLAIGIPALRLIATHFVFAGVAIVFSSACQAFGYGVYSLIISACRQLLVLLPASYLLSLSRILDLIWLAFPISECVSVILCLLFFRRVLRKTGMDKAEEEAAPVPAQ